jgi:hypothetical protein
MKYRHNKQMCQWIGTTLVMVSTQIDNSSATQNACSLLAAAPGAA